MKFRNIQALRALAAYSVVCHHIVDLLNHYIASIGLDILVFASGVDVFFVLSGFVMAAASARAPDITPGRFLRARLARIMPIYWMLTMLAAICIEAGWKLLGNQSASPRYFVTSMLLLPFPNDSASYTAPILFAGWTLIFEMTFYILFALSLFFKHDRARKGVLYGTLTGILVASLLIRNPVLDFLGRPHLLEFAAGVAIWRITRAATLTRTSAWVAIAVAIAALIGSQALPLAAIYKAGWIAAVFGLPAALLVFAAVSLEQRGVVSGNAALQGQGDASYSLYLTHIFVLQAVGKFAIATGLGATLPGLVAVAAVAFLASGVVGTLFHRHVELWLNRLAAGLLGVAKRAPPQPAGRAAAQPA